MAEGEVGRREPELSVVLSTIGMYPVLRRVLDGYGEQDCPLGRFEVVIAIDRAEPDPGAVSDAIGERPYAVRTVTGELPGLSANRNAGRRAARAPLVLFTDNDTIPVARLVSEHLAWHRRHPDEGVAVLGHVRWAPELHVTTFMRWLERGLQFDYPGIEGIDAGPGRFYGANVSLKRSFVARVGDFDAERLPYGYEDIEWSYRASSLGFRVLYNRRAVVDHLREMTIAMWERRIRRVAVAERQLVRLHPELEPRLFHVFSEAARTPPGRERGLRLAPAIGPGVPWLGPRVWASVDLAYKRRLAPHFLEAWEAAGCAESGMVGPDLSERPDLSASPAASPRALDPAGRSSRSRARARRPPR